MEWSKRESNSVGLNSGWEALAAENSVGKHLEEAQGVYCAADSDCADNCVVVEEQ